MCFHIKLGRHVNHGKPIVLRGHSSKGKVTMGMIDKCGVRGDATLYVVIFLLSPRNSVGGDIVTRPMVGGWVSE